MDALHAPFFQGLPIEYSSLSSVVKPEYCGHSVPYDHETRVISSQYSSCIIMFFRKWATIFTSEPVSSVVKDCGHSIPYVI
ncbi:hypothetical protein M378DRAFT_168698 [Amanita muscaria Koide BX008]|uniref:Uncharacterized protein n=1 Tax=Amanita muscaria (strain Koide BX008) TaxID=946122 RepID=A0A0C2T0I3_AMAMK|nr:hypothetical protein M378DRAFT_168698 [Amanita muscaria Koide BX008]